MKPNREDVSKRLKIIKENLGLSLSEMAEEVGSTKAKIDSYMRALALPPSEVIDKIANLADVSKEWIYYGDRKEFIKNYLCSLGYGKLIEDFPNIVDEVYFEYEDRISFNPQIEFPQLDIIKMIFNDIYQPVFQNYIDIICREYAKEIQKYPLYSGTPEYNSNKYLTRVRYLIRQEVPPIKYGEDERILDIAAKEFNTRIQIYDAPTNEYNDDSQDLIDYLIEKLETTKGTLEIISSIASLKNINYNIASKQSDEILEAFQKIRPKLIQIKNK